MNLSLKRLVVKSQNAVGFEQRVHLQWAAAGTWCSLTGTALAKRNWFEEVELQKAQSCMSEFIRFFFFKLFFKVMLSRDKWPVSFAKLFPLLKTVLDSASGLRCYLLKRKWTKVTKMHQSEISGLLLRAFSDFCQASLPGTRSSY